MTIGYIGLGAMGGSLARHLAGGRELSVFDLNSASVASLVEAGARPAGSPRELARTCGIVLLCLPRSSDVEAILFGPDGVAEDLRPGSLVIDQTSGVPTQTAAFADRLAARGVHFMDAPVSGGIPAARNRVVTVLASGPDEAWQRGAAVLDAISSKVMRCGTRVGDGQALKLVTNGLGACYRLSTLEIAALWRRFGLPLSEFVPALNESAGANFTSRNMLVGLVEGRATTDFSMSLMVKDLNGGLDLGVRTARAMPLNAAARGLMQCAIGLFGPDARLEDVVPTVERLGAVSLAGPDVVALPARLPAGLSTADFLATLCRAATACNVAAVVECVSVARGLGIELDAVARVIDAGSAWCRAAGPLLERGDAALGDLSGYEGDAQALAAAVELAAVAGLPFIMPGLASAWWRQAIG